ncbi:MAG: helix-turn-helix domain-containing protein [bacterium]
MSTFATSFKQEVVRLARKEAKSAVSPVRKPAWAMRLDMADLKRRVSALERENNRLGGLLAKIPQPEPVVAPTGTRNWISGKGVRSLRQKLGLSQEDFAKLAGVSANAVGLWESNPGTLRMRDATKAAVMAVRGLGAREAKERLVAMAPVKKAGKAKGRKAGRR